MHFCGGYHSNNLGIKFRQKIKVELGPIAMISALLLLILLLPLILHEGENIYWLSLTIQVFYIIKLHVK